MLKRKHINVGNLETIDAHLDRVDELIIRMELPRSVKHAITKYTYKMYEELEAAVDMYTPKEK